MRKVIPFLLIISITPLLLLNSCRKDHKSDTNSPPLPPGTFVATIDGKKWTPSKYSAGYYPSWHQIYIGVSDSSYSLSVGVNIDSSNLLKQYLLESNGDNEALLVQVSDGTTYYSSHDVLDAGGTFELTKFDTIQKTISGTLHFVAYSSNKSRKKEFTSIEITDIPCTIHALNYNGNTATCTVIGTKTTVWHCKDIDATMASCQPVTAPTLELSINSMLGSVPTTARYIGFRIPLENKAGSYQVYPLLQPNGVTCNDRRFTTFYNLENNSYYPNPGVLKITYLDTALKKLKAEFSLAYRDTVNNNIIQITNRQINLNTWGHFP